MGEKGVVGVRRAELRAEARVRAGRAGLAANRADHGRLMGGRQRKKGGGGKKKKGGRGGGGGGAACPDIEEPSGSRPVELANASFDEALNSLKEEEAFGLLGPDADPEAAAEAAAASAAATEGWVQADTAYEDLQRACQVHASLWAKVDKLTPLRDEWLAKHEENERLGREETSLEKQIDQIQNPLSGTKATSKSNEFFQKARTCRASKKRLAQLNGEITSLTREILNLEERFPIKTKRAVDSRMVSAAACGHPRDPGVAGLLD